MILDDNFIPSQDGAVSRLIGIVKNALIYLTNVVDTGWILLGAKEYIAITHKLSGDEFYILNVKVYDEVNDVYKLTSEHSVKVIEIEGDKITLHNAGSLKTLCRMIIRRW